MNTLQNILIGVLIIYGMFVTYLYNLEYKQRDDYMKNKINYITSKTTQLIAREENIKEKEDILINQEKCMIEVTRLRKIIKNAQNSLNITHTSLLSTKIENKINEINLKNSQKELELTDIKKEIKDGLKNELEGVREDLEELQEDTQDNTQKDTQEDTQEE